MPDSRGLVPATLEQLTEPNVFVAIDLGEVEWAHGSPTRQIVGTFQHKTKSEVVLLAAGDGAEVIIPIQAITGVWWAPLGYRP